MNSNFIITTDSTTDLGQARYEKDNIPCLKLYYTLNGVEKPDALTEDSIKNLYNEMRAGQTVSTSQASADHFVKFWKPFLDDGLDILHVAFSSALSGTINSAKIAAGQLLEEYPDRKIIVADSLAASGGEGLLVRHILDYQRSGHGLEECAEYLESIKLRIHHWFTVDDLVYLKRGGRVGSVAAFIGSLLKIKPVLNVDYQGKLIPREKVKGRKASIKRIFEHTESHIAQDPSLNGYIHITHGDCLDDALYLKKLIENRFDFIKEIDVQYIGTVIGSHSGPGTLAVFFIGDERVD